MRGAAAIFVNPVNWEGVKGTLISAKQAGVPVIIGDAPVKDRGLVLCTVASDNVKAGELAAEMLAKTAGATKIAILRLSVNKACIDRVDGFKAVLAKHPGLRIIDEQEVKGTTESSPVMRT